MTTNQTIDGVPRDSVLQLIEFLADAKAYHKVVIGRCEDCIKSGESSEREECGRIGYRTEKIEQVERLSEELRALLDAPASVESLIGRTGGGMVWHECAVCHIKGSYHPDVKWCVCGRQFELPADQPQGEPVAYRYKEFQQAYENEKPWELATVALGLVYLERKSLAEKGELVGKEREHYMGLTIEPLYAEQPAPVAVLPEHLQQVLKFLDGAENLDGHWFGEPHPSGRPYWWRNELRKALAETNLFAKQL